MTDKKPAIGWIGTGVMGEPMCGHLLAAGYAVSVFSRSRDRAENLLAAGASWCDSPQLVASSSDVVFTMVGSPEEVRKVYFAEDGVLAGLQPGAVVVDMGTTPPSLAQEIAAAAEIRSAQSVDAPVSGGDVGARDATLSIMAGGAEHVVASLQSLFECLGTVSYMGAAGCGQHTKMCNQIAVAGTMIGVCEALVYAARAGLDADELVAAISKGAAACWTLDKLAPRINRKDFTPGFMVDHFVKDLGIALSEAEKMRLDLPGLKLAHELYQKVQQYGHGSSGTQALIYAIQEHD
jgi:3-hydroxyisobutyrate dehydrogenase